MSLGISERNLHGVFYTLDAKNRRRENLKLGQDICFCILLENVAFYKWIVKAILHLVGLHRLFVIPIV